MAKHDVLDVDKIQEPMRETHASLVNLTYEWRMKQLAKLHRLLVDERPAMREAMALDLGRDPTESIAFETKVVENEALYAMKHLKEFGINAMEERRSLYKELF